MSTVALCCIIKDEIASVDDFIRKGTNYFDQFIFVVSDEKAARALKKVHDGRAEIYYRPWNNRFDEARNFAQSKVKTDYWFWIDADDTFDFNSIPKLVQIADQGNYDQIMLPYNYAQDEDGNCVAYHWRERLLRTSHPFVWKGWVHETPISEQPFTAHRVNVEVKHNSSDNHTQESLERNHKILLEATAESDDPRYQMYLGQSLFSLGKYGEAVEVLDKFVKVSGSGEDIYRALCCLSECAIKMKHPQAAIRYALQAAAQVPKYPFAYRLLAQWEDSLGNWDEALEWARVSLSKKEADGMGVYDPTSRYDTILIAVHCEYMLRNFNSSLNWLRKLPLDHEARKHMEPGITQEADDETFINFLPKVRDYFKGDKVLFDSLIDDMKYDPRLRGLRDISEKPKTWSDKSIVFLIGEGYEEWGPHTLDKGMGGSEEAVIYLTRELAKLGWEVTVYGAVADWVKDDIDGHRISYIPWREINKNDNFNVFVAWRAPDFAEFINAKVKIADIHDILNKSTIKPYPDVTYFVKSQFHRDLYPELPDEKFRIIGNGIKKEQF